jgi:hypothetical protein
MRALLVLLLLSACAPAPVVNAYPPVKPYSAEFQSQAAAELEAIKSFAPHVAEMITDYATERAMLRACHG